mmetsp:Transcript_16085/g.42240  ORF Transcript_16085/g.42240 Transcript_16085/m.42240 type:complete len:244 (+) Transcript_16085:238-969(+)
MALESHRLSRSPYLSSNARGKTSFGAMVSALGMLLKPGQFFSSGVPMTLKMSCSCSTSVLPGKRGLPRISSARMHPADHMSTGVPYLRMPISSSGGRYQRVITVLVSRSRVLGPVYCGSIERARPKSASLSSRLWLRRRFEHLRSRCTYFPLCMYSSTLSSCIMMSFTSFVLNLYAWSSRPVRSCSMYSRTRKRSPALSLSSSSSSGSKGVLHVLEVMTSLSATMFSCRSALRILISRTAVMG